MAATSLDRYRLQLTNTFWLECSMGQLDVQSLAQLERLRPYLDEFRQRTIGIFENKNCFTYITLILMLQNDSIPITTGNMSLTSRNLSRMRLTRGQPRALFAAQASWSRLAVR